jgi:hypothetical protein
MEPEWNDECVEGHIRLKKAGRFVLAMREAFQRDVGLHPNVPVEEITRTEVWMQVRSMGGYRFGSGGRRWSNSVGSSFEALNERRMD